MSTKQQVTGVSQGESIRLWDLGVLGQITIGTWSGRKMLTRADMQAVGIDPANLPEQITNLGRKLLVPREELAAFNRIEQQARGYLDRWSIPFGIARANFVPMNLVPDVEARLKEWQGEFMALADRFVVQFEDMKKKLREEHPEFWNKCLKKHYPPTPELLRDKFRFQFFFFKVSGMDAEAITAKQAKMEADIAAQTRNERAREMRIKMQAEVSRFVEEAVSAMREETVQFCELVTARINGEPYGGETEAKKLPPRSIACFRNYVDRFRQMNVFGDVEIEKLLNQFKKDYLPDQVTPKDLQTPQMKKAITAHMEKVRKLAESEDGGMSKSISQLKRKIVL